jgi:hypothetical protein
VGAALAAGQPLLLTDSFPEATRPGLPAAFDPRTKKRSNIMQIYEKAMHAEMGGNNCGQAELEMGLLSEIRRLSKRTQRNPS